MNKIVTAVLVTMLAFVTGNVYAGGRDDNRGYNNNYRGHHQHSRGSSWVQFRDEVRHDLYHDIRRGYYYAPPPTYIISSPVPVYTYQARPRVVSAPQVECSRETREIFDRQGKSLGIQTVRVCPE